MDSLTCPKCHASMRAYERGGVTVDQCTECRGIFLDRGELDRLIDAEAAFNSSQPAPVQAPSQPQYPTQPQYQAPGQPQYQQGQPYDDRRRYDRDDDDHRRPHNQPHRKKKKSFLEDFFD